MKNVILTPNPYRDKNFQTVREAVRILKDAGISTRLCLPFEVDRSYDLPRDLRFSRLDRELPNAEMVICFGGDGTILHMAKAATRKNIPILGVNIGTMGFMAELESTELDKLVKVARGEYTLDSRMMLDVTVQRERDILFHDIYLNEEVVKKGAVARIVHLCVKCDGVSAMEFGGDGVIVSTPTGSTAYSYSAGGPIVEPKAELLLVTPVCPHTINTRSVILAPEDVVEIKIGAGREGSIQQVEVDFDGSHKLSLCTGDKVEIRRAAMTTGIVKISKVSFLEILHKKMSD